MSEKPQPSPGGTPVSTYSSPPTPIGSPLETGRALSSRTPHVAQPPRRIRVKHPIAKPIDFPVSAKGGPVVHPPPLIPRRPPPIQPRILPSPLAQGPAPILPQQRLYKYTSTLMPSEIKAYRETRMSDIDPQVTFIMPVVHRIGVTKACVEAIARHADFPHRFKMIVSPELGEFAEWLRQFGVQVETAFYYPIAKAKDAIVRLCDTEYLFMFDNDLRANTPLKPMLDFMRAHPDVGVCATAMEGTPRHSLLHYGADLTITRGRVWLASPRRKVLPYNYVDYVHHGATLFRMKLFDDVAYDTRFPGQGHEHEDLFTQIQGTDWKVVSYNACTATPLLDRGSMDYRSLRRKGMNDSYRYFREKWNIRSKGLGIIK